MNLLRSRMANSVVYVFSQLNVDEIVRHLPSYLTVKVVKPSDQKTGFDWKLKVSAKDLDALKEAEILISDNTLMSQLIYSLPKLKWAQGMWAGVDPLIKAVDKTKPYPSFVLTRCSTQYFGDAMAEYALAQVINYQRQFYRAWENQRSKKWIIDRFLNNLQTLRDVTIGVLGAGVIGSEVAKAFKQRGSHVVGFVRTPRDETTTKELGFDKLSCDLREVLAECNFLINVLPSTHETIGLLNGDVLKQCQKKPVFLNIGRGSIIKEADLIEALNNGWLSHAVLDVFEVEPLPETSPLWTMENVTITPHIGAITRLEEVAAVFNENYERFIKGEKLTRVVDWENEY